MKPSVFVKSVRLSDKEKAALDAIAQLNLVPFHGFFKWSTVMAVCYVESRFNTHAYRKEPSGVASYGIMQVLNTTAADLARKYFMALSSPDMMFDLQTGLVFGMRYLADGYNYLNRYWGNDVDYESLLAGYNEGYAAVVKGQTDEAYVKIVEPAREHYASMDPEQLEWNKTVTNSTFSPSSGYSV